MAGSTHVLAALASGLVFLVYLCPAHYFYGVDVGRCSENSVDNCHLRNRVAPFSHDEIIVEKALVQIQESQQKPRLCVQSVVGQVEALLNRNPAPAWHLLITSILANYYQGLGRSLEVLDLYERFLKEIGEVPPGKAGDHVLHAIARSGKHVTWPSFLRVLDLVVPSMSESRRILAGLSLVKLWIHPQGLPVLFSAENDWLEMARLMVSSQKNEWFDALWQKDVLARVLNGTAERPHSHILSKNTRNFVSEWVHQSDKTCIVKPLNESDGHGISLASTAADISSLPNDIDYLVEEVVNNPLLIDGHKVDFRAYLVVVSSGQAFLGKSFRVRMASSHINTSTEDAIITAGYRARRRAFNCTYAMSDDLPSKIQNMVNEAVWRTVNSAWGRISKYTQQHSDIENIAHPLIYGLDILVTAEGDGFLLEVNKEPNMRGRCVSDRIALGSIGKEVLGVGVACQNAIDKGECYTSEMMQLQGFFKRV